MRCECGKEILNVPEHLLGLAKWQCKECGRNVDTTGRRIELSTTQNEEKTREIRRKAA